MADAEYIIGTKEYISLKLEATAPGFTFTASEWSAKAALCALGEPFDPDDATWHDALLQTESGVDYVSVLAGDGQALDPASGKYKVFVRLTKTEGGVEVPLLRAVGTVSYAHG